MGQPKGAIKGVYKSVSMTMPTEPRDKRFCEEILNGMALRDAWRAAGFASTSTKQMEAKYTRFRVYLERFINKKVERVAEKLSVDQEGILEKMAAIGFADPASFVVIEDEIDKNTGKVIGVRERLKHIRELTPVQTASITLINKPNGDVTYKPPDAYLRQRAQHDLGLHLGMFHPKLIHEHRHMHLHAAVTLRGVSTENLAQAEQALIAALGPQVAHRMLGITAAELEYSGDTPAKRVDK